MNSLLNVSNRISMVIVRNLTEYLKEILHKGKSGRKASTSSKIWIYPISTADSFGLYHVHFECKAIFKDYLFDLFILRVSRLKYHKRKDEHTYRMIAGNVSESLRLISPAMFDRKLRTLFLSFSLVVLTYHYLTQMMKRRHKFANRAQFLHRHLRKIL